MDSHGDSAGASSSVLSSDTQEDDPQDGYIVEALDSDYTIPEFVYADVMNEDESKTTTEDVCGESETGGFQCTDDVNGIDPTSIPGCSTGKPKPKQAKLIAVAANFSLNGQFYSVLRFYFLYVAMGNGREAAGSTSKFGQVASNQAVFSLAEELRRIHFQAQSSAWRLWANYIHAGPAHERERRTTEMLPQHLLEFFRSVPISEAVKLESVRSGLTVANTINQGFATELEALQEDADQILFMAQRLKTRIVDLRARTAINSGLVSAMSSAVRPEEDEFS